MSWRKLNDNSTYFSYFCSSYNYFYSYYYTSYNYYNSYTITTTFLLLLPPRRPPLTSLYRPQITKSTRNVCMKVQPLLFLLLHLIKLLLRLLIHLLQLLYYYYNPSTTTATRHTLSYDPHNGHKLPHTRSISWRNSQLCSFHFCFFYSYYYASYNYYNPSTTTTAPLLLLLQPSTALLSPYKSHDLPYSTRSISWRNPQLCSIYFS